MKKITLALFAIIFSTALFAQINTRIKRVKPQINKKIVKQRITPLGKKTHDYLFSTYELWHLYTSSGIYTPRAEFTIKATITSPPTNGFDLAIRIITPIEAGSTIIISLKSDTEIDDSKLRFAINQTATIVSQSSEFVEWYKYLSQAKIVNGKLIYTIDKDIPVGKYLIITSFKDGPDNLDLYGITIHKPFK